MKFGSSQTFHGISTFESSVYYNDGALDSVQMNIPDVSEYTVSCQNAREVYSNIVINESSVNLTLDNPKPNSTVNIAIRKEASSNSEITLGGTSLTFRGFNNLSLDTSALVLDSSNFANWCFNVSILVSDLSIGGNTICLVALAERGT